MNQNDNKNILPEDMGLIGRSESFRSVLEIIKQVAPTNITVLITGESGTGKEMAARAIHNLSPRKDKPMITVNCGAIPEGILESELFGHAKGSFTGAVESRKGYFETANGGTIFLDEIGEMSLQTQVKLLRVLEEKEYMEVGGDKIKKVDVRVIAATNKDLEQAVERGEFRQDLFYRLNAVRIFIPPLRKRKEDIRILAVKFAEDVCRTNKIKCRGITEDGFQLMEEYPWPGNIRELRNVIERVIILNRGALIDRALLEQHIGQRQNISKNLPVVLHKSSDQAERELIYRALVEIRMAIEDIRSMISTLKGVEFKEPKFKYPFHAEITEEAAKENKEETLNIKQMERINIEKALKIYKGNRKKAAKALGIGERTLYRKLKEYNLE